jgi:hypothetical protein
MRTRPLITEFLGDGFDLQKAHEAYLNNIELWNYIQALDAYCDELDEVWNEAIKAAAENAKTKNTQVMVNANSTTAYTVGGIEVDKDSILKLLKPDGNSK